MAYQKKSYLEHAAIHVKDIHWHVRFFQEALGMTIRKIDGPVEEPKQVWMFGGPQLVSDPGFVGPEGRMAHLGIMVEDLAAALDEVYTWGVSEMPQGRNWITLPDGLCIELMQATGDSVKKTLAIDPRK
jgi:predicted enzyme related to lactoylglutathione lyase